MEGLLELRPPGIMGKWEERFFRLSYDSFKFYSPDGRSMLGEFPLDQMENVSLEAPELNFVCQGRKSRLRGSPGSHESVIRDWYSKLRSFSGQGPNPGIRDDDDFQDLSPMKPGNMAIKVTSPENTSSPLQVQASPTQKKTRVDMMYEAHQRKLKKLQDKRDKEAEEEKTRLQDEFQRAKSGTRKARGKISQSDVLQTVDRLFNEHKFIRERLVQQRQESERKESERIAETKRMNLPTRTTSEPGLLTAREAGDRLYSDAERRELWRMQARDAQAKDELTMVRIGVKGTSASSMNRCNDLHKEAFARKDKLKKAQEKKEKEEFDAIMKEAVPCGDGRRGVNVARLQVLYDEHQERQKKILQMHNDAVSAQQKEIEVNKIGLKPNKPNNTISSRRNPAPWKDPHYPFNLPKKVNKNEQEQKPAKSAEKPTSPADYALKAIQAAISLRSGVSLDQAKMRNSDYKKLQGLLKKVMQRYTDALHHIQQDPGFASICSRPSQRLFQEHLLPEVEGWTHRLEPDPIRQVEDDLEALLSSAAKAQETLKQDIAPGQPWETEKMCRNPTGVPTAQWAYDPGVKAQAAADTKSLVRYGPGEGPQKRHRHLTDLSRLQLVFPSCDMLQAGLEHILKRFEVVDVRNHFGNPGRLGLRYVEVLVVVIVRDGREQVPHVCELRLEPLHFHNATRRAERFLTDFHENLKRVYKESFNMHVDLNCLQCIARHVLNTYPEGHRLRSFRCHLGRRFGSTVCGWRKALGGGRLLNFQRFREVCYSLNCGEHVTELWQELDPNRGGCISLWELDADAVAVLVKLRTRMLTVLASTQAKGDEDVEETDANVLFARLTSFVRPIQLGSLEQHEFRIVAKPLGLSTQEADKAFACLDHFPGNVHAPPATIDVTDIHWLKRMPNLVYTEAVACAKEANMDAPNIIGSPMTDGSSPLSGPVSAWEAPRTQQTAGPGASPQQKADSGSKKPAKAGKDVIDGAANKQQQVPAAKAPAKGGLSDMGVELGASTENSPNKESTEDAGKLGDLGIDVEDDDDEEDDDEGDYDEDQEEEEAEEEDDDEEDDDEDAAPEGEETW